MKTFLKVAGGLVLCGALVVVGFALGTGVAGHKSLGGGVVYDPTYLVGDVYSGLAQVLTLQDGVFVGSISTSQSATFSGVTRVSQTTSSTLQIGSTAIGVGTGCLVLGSSGGATSSPVYITATGTVISATTTRPAICR